jgi:hypothetical protein
MRQSMQFLLPQHVSGTNMPIIRSTGTNMPIIMSTINKHLPLLCGHTLKSHLGCVAFGLLGVSTIRRM